MAHFHHFSICNQNQSISNLVNFEQNTKAIANMEVTARVLFTLAILYLVLQWSVTENIRNDGSGFNIVTVRCGSKVGRTERPQYVFMAYEPRGLHYNKTYRDVL